MISKGEMLVTVPQGNVHHPCQFGRINILDSHQLQREELVVLGDGSQYLSGEIEIGVWASICGIRLWEFLDYEDNILTRKDFHLIGSDLTSRTPEVLDLDVDCG